ncbi:helix-turn-helix domain-containing protein [Nitratireductor sp. CAU 1489]|uniref:Helix-turn-helix domain-containing protein n=1 Tax=Nitratireductor arenosus TaxID=2682096 RepID=A0A844QC69_9HYPH|nr:Crp/Fnr family transcriptional regulator [Nitratireductor arenosus]MVA96234.1 helix-turn-helix domain-containing protein [Nitratireductor arenosus]
MNASPIPDFEDALGSLDPQERARVRSKLHRLTFEPKQQIFGLGEGSSNLMIVCSGRVKTFTVTSDGHQVTTGIWGAGYVLGLISGLAGMPRVLSCEAIDKTKMDRLSMRDLEVLMADIPKFGYQMASLLARTAAVSVSRIAVFATAPVRGRLIETLLTLGRLPGAQSGPDSAFIRGLSHEDIANMVRASRPWISLTIRDLEDKGYLKIGRMLIEIPSLSALAEAGQEELFG